MCCPSTPSSSPLVLLLMLWTTCQHVVFWVRGTFSRLLFNLFTCLDAACLGIPSTATTAPVGALVVAAVAASGWSSVDNLDREGEGELLKDEMNQLVIYLSIPLSLHLSLAICLGDCFSHDPFFCRAPPPPRRFSLLAAPFILSKQSG